DAFSGFAHLFHGLLQLRATIAAQAAENVAGQALAVDAYQDRLLLDGNLAVDLEADAAQAQGQVRLRVHHRGVGNQVELAVADGHLDGQLAADESLPLATVLDELLDAAQLEAVLAAELPQVGQAGHAALGGHDLADDGSLFQPGQAGQIDAALGVPGADQDAA